MIPAPFNYTAPESLVEARTLLKKHKGARILAGGHSLLAEMKLRHVSSPMLVDLRNIRDLLGIERLANGGLCIGAMTTLVDIARNNDVMESYPALAEAVNRIGDAQVRNRGTIGGNLASGDLGADLPAVILALNATLNIFGPQGTRTMRAEEFVATLYKDGANRDEIIVSVDFPARAAGGGNAFEKFKNRASCYAICGVAASVVRAPDGTLRECCVAVTGSTRQAIRLAEVETALRGKQPTEENMAAIDLIGRKYPFLSDLAASAEYRMHLTRVLTRQALTRAIAHAEQVPE
ncbi:MAG TPA: xanthine dehydrogenase family protein subunit M [Ktedonobacteraceae bacterium]|nr:xanthine dehydrogenase family protein subunit M [Ktedonobacteraceae bacterium]